jgi:hypothetical protein
LIRPSTSSSSSSLTAISASQAADRGTIHALGDQRQLRLLGLMERGSDDLGDPIRGRRLDQLGSAARDQLVADALLAAFERCDVLSHAALPKAGVRAELAAVALRRAAGELERRELPEEPGSARGEHWNGIRR